jgi:hypothetical protein
VTVREWLASRQPSPPPILVRRVEESLRDHLDDDAGAMFEGALHAAAALLEAVVRRPTAGRECALDLLTADALTTYAFEVAASDPAALEERASGAMQRFAEIGARGAT